MNDALIKLLNFNHWQYIAIPLFIFVFIASALEITGIIRPFSASRRSDAENNKLSNRPTKRKIIEFFFWMVLFIAIAIKALQETGVFDSMPKHFYLYLIVFSTIMIIVTKKYAPKDW